ncbi:MAG: hypothetical protein ACTSV5_14070 [Promethearchaeota archaeon]
MSIVLLNFLVICIFLNINVKAQGFALQIKVNDEFVWEVKELNKDKFEYTFNAEPNFDIGDQKKIAIREITEIEGLRWTVVVAFWDFKTDWVIDGEIEYLSIYKEPLDYNDPLFVPTPVDDYFEIAMETLPSEYYLNSPFTIGRQARSDTGVKYRIEKSFDINGIIISETFFDAKNSVIVKMERSNLLIPLGFSFIGFMTIGIISMIAIFLKKNKIRFS